MSILHVYCLGLIHYKQAWNIQEHCVQMRKASSIGDMLLLMQHFPVITLGRSFKKKNLLISEAELKKKRSISLR